MTTPQALEAIQTVVDNSIFPSDEILHIADILRQRETDEVCVEDRTGKINLAVDELEKVWHLIPTCVFGPREAGEMSASIGKARMILKSLDKS